MKKILTTLLFNLLVCVGISAATGFNPLVLMFAGMGLSSITSAVPSGAMNMAIQKELWMNHIIEELFADNSFLSKAFSADEYVNAGRTVHIPNAGSPSNVVKNRTTKPATVGTRTDVPLSFNLDEFTTDPIYIPHADTVELSYNKRESVLRQDKAKLKEKVAESFLLSWSPLRANSILSTGSAVMAHTASATGNRKAISKEDVAAMMTKFNEQDVPQDERYLLLDAQMYLQLLNSLTANEAQAFHAGVDTKNGILGKLLTFNIMMRSKALRFTGAAEAKSWDTGGAATDCAAALAWHKDSVCRALGEVVAYENEGDPTWYGDIYSFLVRAGGRPMRNDSKGFSAIIQNSAA